MAKISKSKMAELFHRLAIGYKAGIGLRTLLDKESKRGSPVFRRTAASISALVNDGDALSNAMRAQGDYFPQMAVSVVEAGERGGRLEEAFGRLSQHYSNLVKFRNSFLLSIAWPLFEIGLSILILSVMILVMGWVMRSYPGGQPIDWFGFGLSVEGNFVLYWVIVGVVLGGFFLLVYGTIKGWFGLLPMKIARRLPLIGSTIEALALSRFAWTMSITQNAGMNPMDMARLGFRATENYYYTRLEPQVCDGLQEGRTFAQCLSKTRAFPDSFLIHVENGEMTGELAESMDRASTELEGKAKRNLKLLGTIGFVCMLLFTGLLIGGTVIYLYYTLMIKPVNDLLNELTILFM